MSEADARTEATNIFALYNTNNNENHTVPGKYYAEMLRAVGLVPNDEDEIRETAVKKEEFIQRVSNESSSGQHSAHSELAGAFKMFDTGQTGKINTSTIRNILCNLGERLDAADVETVVAKIKQMGRQGNEGDHEINIEKFTEMVLKDR